MSEPLKIVVATANPGKAREFARLLGEAAQVEPLPPDVTMPSEPFSTFAQNAQWKAAVVFAALGGGSAVLADDSGLEVEALGQQPGVLSARFAGVDATDADNVEKLLASLEGRDDREARFVCCLCMLLPAGGAIQVEGAAEGTITEAPRGTDGFGYDPVFQPAGWSVTLGEAGPQEKDQVSHRGAAARALLSELAARGFVDRAL